MHQAQRYIDTHLRPSTAGAKLSSVHLSSPQAASLTAALRLDGLNYFYSGIVSICDAVQAVERSLYSWATVKLYYSAFYLARAQLALRGVALFYDGTKPFSWRCVAGQAPIKRDGQTHKAVLATFAATYPANVIVTQEIDARPALDWLMARREAVNYGASRFSEPVAPLHFERIAGMGVRRSVAAYVRDETHLYAFDPDHAILALPIEALKQTMRVLEADSCPIPMSPDEKRYVQALCADAAGPIPEFAAILR